MKKSLIACGMCAAFVSALALGNLVAADAPDGIKMAKTKQPVVFNHSTHKEVKDCKECHHEGKDNQKCSDAGCHDILDKADKSPKSYYVAIHSMTAKKASCLACHKKAAGDDAEKKKALTGCKGSKCHPA